MTFTEKQQKEHREAFIHECRQKAWGALCHAEWISKNLDDLLALYQKFQAEDTGFVAGLTALIAEAFAIRNQFMSGSDDSIEAMTERLGIGKGRLTSLVRLSHWLLTSCARSSRAVSQSS